MLINLDKHDLTMIEEALDLLADEVVRNEAPDVGYRWRPYNKDDVLNMINYLRVDEEDDE